MNLFWARSHEYLNRSLMTLVALVGDTLPRAHPDPGLHLQRPRMTLKSWVFCDKR